MTTFKKLLITLSAVLFITLGLNNTAYATELIDLDNDIIIDEASDIEDAQDIETVDEEASSSDTEEIYDLESYEIYVDEQGQIYYLEKEPVELEILDSDEIVPEDVTEEDTEQQGTTDKEKKKEKKPSYSEKDLRLLSCLIYTEAGNQSYNGMLAVANVVLNRVKSPAYYHVNTIEEVIYDKQWAVQFSVTIKSKKTGKSMLDKALEAYDTREFTGKNPTAEKKAMERAIKAAKAALNGKNNIDDYLCFRVNNSGAKSIKKKYSDYRILGNHIFYRTK